MDTKTVEVTSNCITVNVTVPIDLFLGKEVDFGNGAIVLPKNKKEAIDYVAYIKSGKVPISEFDIEGVEYHRVNTIEGILEQMDDIVRFPESKLTLFEKQNSEFGASIIKIITPNK